MQAFQEFINSDAAADAMKYDGVKSGDDSRFGRRPLAEGDSVTSGALDEKRRFAWKATPFGVRLDIARWRGGSPDRRRRSARGS
jgi:hypothetical protein